MLKITGRLLDDARTWVDNPSARDSAEFYHSACRLYGVLNWFSALKFITESP